MRPVPCCPFCDTTQGLRIASQDPWGGHVEYICEGCFTPQDDGPCFDDLPLIDLAEHARIAVEGMQGEPV